MSLLQRGITSVRKLDQKQLEELGGFFHLIGEEGEEIDAHIERNALSIAKLTLLEEIAAEDGVKPSRVLAVATCAAYEEGMTLGYLMGVAASEEKR